MRSTACLLTGFIGDRAEGESADLVTAIAHTAATLVLPQLSLALELCELGLLSEDLIPSLLHFGAAAQQPISIVRRERNGERAACVRGAGCEEQGFESKEEVERTCGDRCVLIQFMSSVLDNRTRLRDRGDDY